MAQEGLLMQNLKKVSSSALVNLLIKFNKFATRMEAKRLFKRNEEKVGEGLEKERVESPLQ